MPTSTTPRTFASKVFPEQPFHWKVVERRLE